jgi:hypothetical protein
MASGTPPEMVLAPFLKLGLFYPPPDIRDMNVGFQANATVRSLAPLSVDE